ncbi:MAG: AI-2E family transporter [Gemmatimonadaceae bacterium]|nr:AI-2E family transporter [Gemmatimonadaceae bacterium]
MPAGAMTADHDPGAVPDALDRAFRTRESSSLAPAVDARATAAPAGPGAPTPDLTRTGDAIDQHRSRSVEVTLITVLAVLYTMYFARSFLIPIVFATLLNFLLSPLIRRMAKRRVKPPIGAAIVVLVLLTGIGWGTYELATPAQRWASIAPQSFAKAQDKLRGIIKPMQQVSRNVEQAANAVGSSSGKSKEVVVQSGPSMTSRVFGTTQRIVAALFEIFILLYFLLAGGDLFLQKLIKVLPNVSDKAKAVEIARATEATVSAYLTTTFLVNLVEGAMVALVLWMLGMPSAVLWGVLVFFLEFVPYLGAAAAVVVLGLAGLTTFDEVGRALLIPGSFLAINILQANLVSPWLLGHRLTLNPVAIFAGLAFFYWLWGVPGAFLAVPLLATFKIFCDNIQSLAAIGEFLGQRDEDERRQSARA